MMHLVAAREHDIDLAQNALAPSSAAILPRFSTKQTEQPVLNGRPFRNYGLPVGLFHPAFNLFQAIMNESPKPADYATYASTRELFGASADIYKEVERRISTIDQHLDDLLGTSFTTVNGPGVRSDGVITHPCGKHNAYLVIREVKNEIGTDGNTDPYNEGCLAYRKYWADKKRK